MTKRKFMSLAQREKNFNIGLTLGTAVIIGLLLLAMALSGRPWHILAYAVVSVVAVMVLMSTYFWGSMIFGGVLELFSSRRRIQLWSTGDLRTVEHDIDPGLELIAAGMLVYRVGEVKPSIHFRKVPLTNARSIRPFIVARTGAERPHHFQFMLYDEADIPHFQQEFAFTLKDEPQMVTPPQRIMFNKPKKVIGQRWTLQVRSGVTMITSLRFMFIETSGQTRTVAGSPGAAAPDQLEPIPERQQELLMKLLDQTLKMDVMTSTQEIILEDV